MGSTTGRVNMICITFHVRYISYENVYLILTHFVYYEPYPRKMGESTKDYMLIILRLNASLEHIMVKTQALVTGLNLPPPLPYG